jgi:hypothetical protein
MPRGKRRGRAGRRGRPSLLSSIATADLQQELERRKGMLDDLVRQRDALNAELEALGGSAGGENGSMQRRRPGRPAGSGRRGPGRPPGARSSGRGRPRKEGGLVSTLHQVLSGNSMSVSDVADAVKKAGYKTKSPNFRTIVNQALLANKNLFRKVDRGVYTAK